jgi:hypothetical protein
VRWYVSGLGIRKMVDFFFVRPRSDTP